MKTKSSYLHPCTSASGTVGGTVRPASNLLLGGEEEKGPLHNPLPLHTIASSSFERRHLFTVADKHVGAPEDHRQPCCSCAAGTHSHSEGKSLRWPGQGKDRHC
ncbi:hypothetical protein PFLUV_G00237130 [Perca fluviatilis]|uniref:Uncharacterized protein n=1 Tax=Perca fluviatilis TaxID=8168 RepID=A0A6A5EAB0_PERFL|nr:hypothetical protein PFLUV_G00237130 [Perca fluviatilis]